MLKIQNAVSLALIETHKKYVKRSTIRNIVRKETCNLGTGDVDNTKVSFLENMPVP